MSLLNIIKKYNREHYIKYTKELNKSSLREL